MDKVNPTISHDLKKNFLMSHLNAMSWNFEKIAISTLLDHRPPPIVKQNPPQKKMTLIHSDILKFLTKRLICKFNQAS